MKRTTSTRISPRPSRAIATLLGASFVIPLGIILVLLAADVRLGQGYFAYRYSPVRGLRTTRAAPAVLIGAAAAGAVMLLSRRDRRHRAAGYALLIASLAGAGIWIWFAPPAYLNQQLFNMTSPSSDGAFALEARDIKSLPAYLRDDFPRRLKLTPQQLGGTRVLSNPPLTTVLAYAVRGDTYSGTDRPPTPLERWLIDEHDVAPEQARQIAYSLRLSILLCILWTLSGVAAFLLGRVFLSPAGAAVFAIIVTFNPCTLHFVPGKDPGQLLTINLMLWAWFAAWRRRSPLVAALGGAILVIGATAGLIHLWIALIAVAATAWQAWRTRTITMLLVNAFAAGVGALAVISAAYFVLDWNIPAMLLAVSNRWGEIQKTFDMSRAKWFMIGLPIFLLFLAPGIWTLAGLSLRRRRMNFGTRLALCTVAVMLLIYVVMGVTYELPRLWVAFLPPLMLGLAIDRPLLRAGGRGRAGSEHPRVARALALIVIVHVAFTAMHWTLFDAREAEYRLVTQRYYN
ncbi:MAG: hypothetical protein QOF78_613 [Phycisphaerales bacterium]|jgi:hypothetical protein|nr:hypothetical protein [Phycisphaerales bacterium]